MNRMHDRGRAALLSSAAIFALAFASPAFAQGQPAQQPRRRRRIGSATNGNAEEIIITAQKRAQVLLDVPQSVTVVAGETLESQHANSFQDYLKLVPGCSSTSPTQARGG